MGFSTFHTVPSMFLPELPLLIDEKVGKDFPTFIEEAASLQIFLKN